MYRCTGRPPFVCIYIIIDYTVRPVKIRMNQSGNKEGKHRLFPEMLVYSREAHVSRRTNMDTRIEILTMCMVWDKTNDQVLLMNRPDRKGFPGYIAPGGR